jgi:signal transduction histidine kinase
MNSASNTTEEHRELSRIYHSDLQKFLRQSSDTDLDAARNLGNLAIAIGLDTLDMARIHEIALIALVLPSCSVTTNNQLMGRAGIFFAESITPIERTHRGAREANALELAESVTGLQEEIIQRKVVEESLRMSQKTSVLLLKKSQMMQEELRDLSRQLLSAQEEERRKISRELHDVIAQTLTGINLRLASLKSDSFTNTSELQKKITSTQRLVEESVEIVHRFARELRPTVLDDLGLIPALQSYMKVFMAETGVRVSLKASAIIEKSSGAIRTALFRIIQESLKNVGRHANASEAEVCIHCLDGMIRVEISDNGQGFAVEEKMNSTTHNRLGLLGMRERVEMIGGTFGIESASGAPTTVRVVIPFAAGIDTSIPVTDSDTTQTTQS